MFSKAYLKLAGFYLLIIMTISFLFSTTLYFAAVGELERGAGRQRDLIESILDRPMPGQERMLSEQRQEALDEAKSRVIGRLIVINLLILVIAGGLSYYLARRSLQPIEEAHKSLERFTADASHELRTPITAMQTEIEVALSDPKLTLKSAKEQLNSNLEELEKLTSLSDGLLRLARLDNTYMSLDEVSLEELIETAVARVKPLAKKKKIKLDVKKMQPVTIIGDQTSLMEGFVIVLDNAIKYSPEKSTVTVKTSSKKHTTRISVTDQGVGIKATELPHIFDRFYRADSSRTNSATHGYGLGLAIAKNTFVSHHGSITATSKQDKGTTFEITLPTK